MVLTGSGTASDPGLHARYNPGDLSSGECRARLKNATTFEEQREVYAAICARFRPAFRFFFLERYPDPALWYRRRLHYTRSAAAASIVGYVLGIGDRHATNILLDEATAGIVHIDFGFTFEQVRMVWVCFGGLDGCYGRRHAASPRQPPATNHQPQHHTQP